MVGLDADAHQGKGQGGLDHADATQQREAGGDLAEHVRQEQAWPRDAEPQGDKRQAEGGAIRHPVGGGDGACSHPAKRSQRDRIAPLQAARFLSSASTPAGDSRDQSADSLEPRLSPAGPRQQHDHADGAGRYHHTAEPTQHRAATHFGAGQPEEGKRRRGNHTRRHQDPHDHGRAGTPVG